MCCCSVAGRLFYLQVLRYQYYSELSQGNRIRTEPIPPSRGLILDRNGLVLADNAPAFNLELVREQVGNMKAVDATLAQLVGIGVLRAEEVNAIHRTIQSHKVYESVPIKLQMDEEEMARFAVHRFQFSGVDIHPRLARHYPLKEVGVHAIGYVSAINDEDLKSIDSAEYAGTSLIGKLGVERAYEAQLHGKPGFREILVNAAGRPVDRVGEYAPELKSRPPVAGDDLVLGMDLRVQKVAEEALAGKRGSVVALDPKTGDIIALGEHAGLRPERLRQGADGSAIQRTRERHRRTAAESRLARRISAGFHGEAVVCLGGAEIRNHFAPADSVLSRVLQLPGSSNKYRDDEVHHNVDMRSAIARSCDVYFYRVAEKMGIDRMHEFMSAFGYGELTGIDIPGEKPGLYASPAWKRRVFKRRPIRYGFPAKPSAWASARARSM
jgi:penicillin-binding protein 2